MQVKTFDGSLANKSKCKRIKGEFYEINKQCFLMEDGKWHRINNGLIAYDHEVGKYVLKSKNNLVSGVVGLEEDGSKKMGFFSKNLLKNVRVDNYWIIDEKTAIKCGYIEDISTGRFHKKDQLSIRSIREFMRKRITRPYGNINMNYSAKYNIPNFTKSFETYFESNAKVDSKLVSALGSTTFGIEFETSDGMIPENKTKALGLIPLIDGSLRHDGVSPYEYTTIPHGGENGLKAIVEDCRVLQKYTTISHQCALHIHIGGYPCSKEFALSTYVLGRAIQDELYEMVPYNYRYTSDNHFKNKDYCSPLPELNFSGNLDKDFRELLLSYGVDSSDYYMDDREDHPSDSNGDRKWNIPYRYKGINLIPLLWGRSQTVEFRMHNPTQNEHKVMAWLFITKAIVDYAYKNKDAIYKHPDRKVELSSIINETYSEEIANTLNNYIKYRKACMKYAAGKRDFIGDNDLITDTTGSIKYSLLN